MSTYTPLLHITEVAPTQTSKEITINTGFAVLEAAANASEEVDASAGNVTISVDAWTKHFFHAVTGHAVARTLTVPATERFCVFSNNGTADIVIHCAASAGADLTIEAGKVVLVHSDGVDVVAISSSGSNLAALSDVDLTGLTDGQVLAWNAADAKFEFVDMAAGGAGPLTVSGQAAAYTVVLADANSLIEVNSATPVSQTIPSNATAAFAIGDQISFAQAGAGQVTIAPAGGVTLRYPADLSPKTRLQHAMLTAIKIATDTWRVTGDLAAA